MIVSENIVGCSAFLHDVDYDGGSAAFGQFKVAVPMLGIDVISGIAHYAACGNVFDLGIGPF